MMDFDEWWKEKMDREAFITNLCETSKEPARSAWNQQQAKIDELQAKLDPLKKLHQNSGYEMK